MKNGSENGSKYFMYIPEHDPPSAKYPSSHSVHTSPFSSTVQPTQFGLLHAEIEATTNQLSSNLNELIPVYF